MAPSSNSPQDHPRNQDAPPQIVIRAATILANASADQQQSSPAIHAVDVQTGGHGDDDSDDATTSDSQQALDRRPSDSPSRQLTACLRDAEDLPIIEDTGIKLTSLLREHQIKCPSSETSVTGFWTVKLLRRIFSRERLRSQLEEDYKKRKPSKSIDNLIDAIRPEQEPHPGSPEDRSQYLRIYALLLLCEKSHEIDRFVRNGQSDSILPIEVLSRNGELIVVNGGKRTQELSCFRRWTDLPKDYIKTYQWRMLTPYFKLGEGNRAIHRVFPDDTILPWCHRDDRNMTSTEASVREGGFAFVSKVRIHPTSHGFGEVLKAIQLTNELFALKQLRVSAAKSNQKDFDNEYANLQRFNGLVHDHLVTLLATFTFKSQYHFLFPCAECALDIYWEDHFPTPNFDLITVRWVSKQMAGIMAAIDIIHEPNHLSTLEVKRYGRHGDIKPDNILWFRSAKDRNGILVVSDMGLTSFNRDVSRSNIPGNKIPGAPGYRPPECEVKGGKVSRAFDIWTLGCLFLELTTWLLGGWALLEEFERARKTPYINGIRTNIFFTLKVANGNTVHVAQVKEEVTKWFIKLHAHERCTDFIHDVLDIIENKMLLVLSQGKVRAKSEVLRRDFNDIHARCMDERRLNYAMTPTPATRPFRRQTAVEAELDKVALETIGMSGVGLAAYEGNTRKSLLPEEFQMMDEPGAIGG
ncbi:kinase-like domain-containing protein [Apodospora peruviana]|uniref:Kinase-like domain-containing protein n=1 Tax=Apodospora peruviana TaxID=516989 RepID=A0AAE0HWM0_9PEZI|nr:kinase-like domain-containing protein [Apodospora peruviana]